MRYSNSIYQNAFASIITSCAAMLPIGALAQSSVTLYGRLDAGFLYTSKSLSQEGGNGGKQFQLINSGLAPSVFGLAGHEDIGGGNKVNFDLESGISVVNGGLDNTNGNLFGRQAWVSLSNNMGELKAGQQFSPFVLALFDSDPRSLSQFGSSIVVYADNTATGILVSNAVSYTSPKVAGVTGSMMYAFGGVAGDFKAGRQYSASLKYEYGGVLVNAAIDDESYDPATNNNLFEMPFEGRTLGIAYRFSKVNLKGSFTNYKVAAVSGLTNGSDNDVWNIGFDYFPVPYLDINAGVWYERDAHDSSNHGVMAAFGTTYSLSKSTSLYAQVGLANNHGVENLGLSVDGAMKGPPGSTFGATVGILHSF